MQDNPSDLSAVIQRLESTHEPIAGNVGVGFDPTAPAHLIIPIGMTVHDLTEKHLAALPAPVRRSGTLTLHDLASFKLTVDRFGDTNAMIYADESARSLTCIFDHHRPDGPGWGRFRAHYGVPFSPEWRAWAEADGNGMSQEDFAEFLEDRILDVVTVDPSKLPEKVRTAMAEMNARVAGPSDMMTLSRGLSVTSAGKATSKFDPSSGESKLVYEDTHQDGTGQPLRVPNLFVISIPITLNGEPYLIPIRLRYRLSNGTIRWFIVRWRPEVYLKDAFDDIVKAVEETTAVVVRGTAPDRFAAR